MKQESPPTITHLTELDIWSPAKMSKADGGVLVVVVHIHVQVRKKTQKQWKRGRKRKAVN